MACLGDIRDGSTSDRTTYVLQPVPDLPYRRCGALSCRLSGSIPIPRETNCIACAYTTSAASPGPAPGPRCSVSWPPPPSFAGPRILPYRAFSRSRVIWWPFTLIPSAYHLHNVSSRLRVPLYTLPGAYSHLHHRVAVRLQPTRLQRPRGECQQVPRVPDGVPADQHTPGIAGRKLLVRKSGSLVAFSPCSALRRHVFPRFEDVFGVRCSSTELHPIARAPLLCPPIM